jgi:hypothetical protein
MTDIGRERPSLTLGRVQTLRIPGDRAQRVRQLAAEWEREDVERRRGPRPLPWILLLAIAAACAGPVPVAPVEVTADPCAEIVDAHCQRVAECRGTSYELCVTGVDQYCPAWNPEPECVEDIWAAECEPEEMPLPCSCGSGTPGC